MKNEETTCLNIVCWLVMVFRWFLTTVPLSSIKFDDQPHPPHTSHPTSASPLPSIRFASVVGGKARYGLYRPGETLFPNKLCFFTLLYVDIVICKPLGCISIFCGELPLGTFAGKLSFGKLPLGTFAGELGSWCTCLGEPSVPPCINVIDFCKKARTASFRRPLFPNTFWNMKTNMVAYFAKPWDCMLWKAISVNDLCECHRY